MDGMLAASLYAGLGRSVRICWKALRGKSCTDAMAVLRRSQCPRMRTDPQGTWCTWTACWRPRCLAVGPMRSMRPPTTLICCWTAAAPSSCRSSPLLAAMLGLSGSAILLEALAGPPAQEQSLSQAVSAPQDCPLITPNGRSFCCNEALDVCPSQIDLVMWRKK